MADEEWGNYHSLMLRDEGAEEGLTNLRESEFTVGESLVKILDASFTSRWVNSVLDIGEAKIRMEKASNNPEIVKNEIVTNHPFIEIPKDKVIHRTTRTTRSILSWNSCENFRVIFQIGDKVEELTGTLSDLNFCLWRRQDHCPYCTDFYDTDFVPYPNFNEWFIGEISLNYES